MYLLDTSVVSNVVNARQPKHQSARDFIQQNALFLDQVYLSAVTVSEAEFGLNLLKLRRPAVVADLLAEIERRVTAMAMMGTILPIDRHVAREHARLRAAYAAIKVPRQVASGTFKKKHVELWHEEILSSQLQISENDIWIAATALTHDLVLVTVDSDHEDLRRACPELRVHRL